MIPTTTTGDAAGQETPSERLRYLVVLSRPRFWLYLAGPVAVGAVYGASTLSDLAAPVLLVLFAYFLVPANVFLYGINDVYDAEIDAENPKKDEEGREARWDGQRFVIYAVAICGALAIPVALLLPTAAWLWVALFVLLGAEYSAPPARFKTTPLLDSLSNGLYVVPAMAAYATVAGTQPPIVAVIGAWCWAMAMHTFSAIPDIEPDRRAGIRTTATLLGERATYAYCTLVWALAAVAFGLLDPRLGGVFAVYPVLVAGIGLSSVHVDRAYWWYPAINTAVGAVLTMGKLWEIAPPV